MPRPESDDWDDSCDEITRLVEGFVRSIPQAEFDKLMTDKNKLEMAAITGRLSSVLEFKLLRTHYALYPVPPRDHSKFTKVRNDKDGIPTETTPATPE